jgi:tetratricopeptide (TPR) repeat protein
MGSLAQKLKTQMRDRLTFRKAALLVVLAGGALASLWFGTSPHAFRLRDCASGEIRYLRDWWWYGGPVLQGYIERVDAARQRVKKGTALAGDFDTLATWEINYGRQDTAARYLQEGIHRYPDAVGLYFRIASIQIQKGEAQKAFALFQKCPCRNYFYYECLGWLHAHAGNLDASKAAYESALSAVLAADGSVGLARALPPDVPSSPTAAVAASLPSERTLSNEQVRTAERIRQQLQEVTRGEKPRELLSRW